MDHPFAAAARVKLITSQSRAAIGGGPARPIPGVVAPPVVVNQL